MTAFVYTEYGEPDGLRPLSVPIPTPDADEVLIATHATSVNAGDLHLLRGRPVIIRLMFPGIRRPKTQILGADVAGEVVAVGDAVTRFEPGDAVVADVSSDGFGAFAEYVTATEAALARKPDGLSFADAAAVPEAGVAALQALRDEGGIRAGQSVLVNGASGGVGTFAVQLASHFGAAVTGVCSTEKVDVVRDIGADHVVDYTVTDFTESAGAFELIVDFAAAHPLRQALRALKPGGTYVLVGGDSTRFFGAMAVGPLVSRLGDKTVRTLSASPNGADLQTVLDLVAAGDVTPVVDRTFPFADLPDALRYLDAGLATGKVVVTIED